MEDFPYSAIAVGWGWDSTTRWTGDLHFRSNVIRDFLKMGSDGGGIYFMSNQPGSDISSNWIDGNFDPGRKHIETASLPTQMRGRSL